MIRRIRVALKSGKEEARHILKRARTVKVVVRKEETIRVSEGNEAGALMVINVISRKTVDIAPQSRALP